MAVGIGDVATAGTLIVTDHTGTGIVSHSGRSAVDVIVSDQTSGSDSVSDSGWESVRQRDRSITSQYRRLVSTMSVPVMRVLGLALIFVSTVSAKDCKSKVTTFIVASTLQHPIIDSQYLTFFQGQEGLQWDCGIRDGQFCQNLLRRNPQVQKERQSVSAAVLPSGRRGLL